MKQIDNKKQIGEKLHSLRLNAGLTAPEVSDLLKAAGVTVGPKAVYTWERDRSLPNAVTLLELCRIYSVSDVMAVFGYGEKSPAERVTQSDLEMLKQYRSLPDSGREHVRTVIEWEQDREQSVDVEVV